MKFYFNVSLKVVLEKMSWYYNDKIKNGHCLLPVGRPYVRICFCESTFSQLRRTYSRRKLNPSRYTHNAEFIHSEKLACVPRKWGLVSMFWWISYFVCSYSRRLVLRQISLKKTWFLNFSSYFRFEQSDYCIKASKG